MIKLKVCTNITINIVVNAAINHTVNQVVNTGMQHGHRYSALYLAMVKHQDSMKLDTMIPINGAAGPQFFVQLTFTRYN